MEIFIFLLTIVIVTVLVRMLLRSRNYTQKNAQQIRKALVRLFKRPFGAYLIVEEPAFGKFVQFTGSVEEPLVFDLPGQSLTLDEFERARQLFAELGYPGPETFKVFTAPGGEVAGTQTSFIVPFGDDIDNATELALEVFAKVYAVGNRVSLILTEK